MLRIILCLFIFSPAFGQEAGPTTNKRIPPIKNGGYVIFEKNGHGLIATVENLGKMDFKQAQKTCEELTQNGFDDWRLPTKEELKDIYNSGNDFIGSGYWSSSEGFVGNFAWRDGLAWGFRYARVKTDGIHYVRPVRTIEPS